MLKLVHGTRVKFLETKKGEVSHQCCTVVYLEVLFLVLRMRGCYRPVATGGGLRDSKAKLSVLVQTTADPRKKTLCRFP